MVIVRILGGLGNQLFQYAAAKALAVKNNTQVKLDLAGFADDDLRNFELDKFRLNYGLASEKEIRSLKAANSFQRIKARLSPAAKKRFYKEPHFRFDPGFFSLRSPVYLQGYFQSERYFLPVADEIRKAFVFRDAFSPGVEALTTTLRSENSVALHIRRGDYKNAESLRVHGVLPMDYYRNAINHLTKTIGSDLRLYLFSDDPQVAATELALPNLTILSGVVSRNHYEDFYLMQQCRHNVIANSSFSWWAAWLNNHSNKTVVAPKNWFHQGPTDTQDLLPQNWIRL